MKIQKISFAGIVLVILLGLAVLLLNSVCSMSLCSHSRHGAHDDVVSKRNLESYPNPEDCFQDSGTILPVCEDNSNTNWMKILASKPISRFRNIWTFDDWLQPTANGLGQPGAQQAYDNGAKSMLTFRIVDTQRNPIPDVDVSIYPYVNWNRKKIVCRTTDGTGIVVVSDERADRYEVFASKEGFYDGNITFEFFNHNHVCVENGRWLPWNPHVDVVMKPIGKPVELLSYRSWEPLLKPMPVGTDVPFDFLAFDYLPPYGSGRTTNAVFHVEGSIGAGRARHSVTTLSFPYGGGVRRECVNGYSAYVLPCEISDGVFTNSVSVAKTISEEYEWTVEGELIHKVEYFALKIPVTTEDGGKHFHYGLIVSGPIADVCKTNSSLANLCLECYLNPNPDDCVVESKSLRY